MAYENYVKPERSTERQEKRATPKWFNADGREARQSQESPIKRWWLEQQAEKGIIWETTGTPKERKKISSGAK